MIASIAFWRRNENPDSKGTLRDYNDINGFHVNKEHVFEAIDSARAGVLEEGNVGGRTGMWLYGFKGGTGTHRALSRLIAAETLKGTDDNIMFECPEERLIDILEQYIRIKK